MSPVRLAALAALLPACLRVGPNELPSVGPEVRPPIAYFLDQSYVSRPQTPPRLLYEGQPTANIVLSQSIERAGTSVRRDTLGAWYRAHTLILSPMFVIRQMVDSSAAVPPPSFMPKLTHQQFLLRKELRNTASMPTDPVDRERFMRNPANWARAHVILGDVIFGHHSNGQAGCFYLQQHYVPRPGAPHDNDCAWNNADSSDRTLNYAQGSFSTWYLRAGAGYAMMWGFEGDFAIPAHRAGLLASFQYLIPAMTEDPQKPLYGDKRFRVVAEYSWRLRPRPIHSLGPLSLRLAGTGDWALNAGPGIPSWQRSVEAALNSEKLLGFGLFVRRYSGQDYYNINFTKRLDVTHVGVAIRYERPQAFVP